MDLPTREPTKSEVAIVQKIKQNMSSWPLHFIPTFLIYLWPRKSKRVFACSPGKLWQTIEFVFSSLLIFNFAVKYFLSILSEIVNPRQIRRLTTGLLTKEHQNIPLKTSPKIEQQNTIILHTLSFRWTIKCPIRHGGITIQLWWQILLQNVKNYSVPLGRVHWLKHQTTNTCF